MKNISRMPHMPIRPAERISINQNDKRCVSLFLASLLVDGDVKKTMNDCGVYGDDLFEYLGIEEKNIKPLSQNEYDDLFSDKFNILLNILVESPETKELTSEEFIPELIISSLCFGHVCGSDIIDWFYYDNKLASMDACSHSSFNNLRKTAKLKLEKMGKVKKQNTSNSMSSNLPWLFSLDEQKSKEVNLLDKYGNYLTDKEFETNPAIGREREITNLMIALLTPDKSALLVGEAGVGKTAIVEGLAYLIKTKQVPKAFTNHRIVSINTSTILSGCQFAGMFEERVEAIMAELIKEPNTILFLDEIHNVIGAGTGSKQIMDFANILKPYLDHGQIKMIGATTCEEYEEYLSKDKAFKRRFEKINITEPDEFVVTEILQGTIPKLEKNTGIEFGFDEDDTSTILSHLVKATDRKHRVYNDQINNPDLALTLLERSFAISAFYDSQNVEPEYLAYSIMDCDRLYSSARKRHANALLADFEQPNQAMETTTKTEEKPKCKIISFTDSLKK